MQSHTTLPLTLAATATAQGVGTLASGHWLAYIATIFSAVATIYGLFVAEQRRKAEAAERPSRRKPRTERNSALGIKSPDNGAK